MRREETQLDATEWFIALVICSTYFGHYYVHHQELETILLILPHMCVMPWFLVVGVQEQGSSYASEMKEAARLESFNTFTGMEEQQGMNKAATQTWRWV
jgi:purine-cytosine permease-like protein